MLERIDRYSLEERIGAGGQATVYRGHEPLAYHAYGLFWLLC